MAVITVGKLLDRGRGFEIQMEAYYIKVRDRSTDNDVRLLTYFLARHRRHQAMALEAMAPGVVRNARKIKLRFDVPFDPIAELRLPDSAPEAVEGGKLIEAAIHHGRTLVGSLYRPILEQTLRDDDAREVLEALIQVEERDIVMLKKMLAMRYFKS